MQTGQSEDPRELQVTGTAEKGEVKLKHSRIWRTNSLAGVETGYFGFGRDQPVNLYCYKLGTRTFWGHGTGKRRGDWG